MPRNETPHSHFRLSAKTKNQLADLAARKGVNQTAVLTLLINEAAEGHQDYFLRTACMDAHTTNAMMIVLMREIFKGKAPETMDRIVANLEGLFGPQPDVPEDIRSYRGRDLRAAALFAAYDQGPGPEPA